MIGRKIVLIGTHGVGKTTLLNDFHAAHPEISVKNELIREIAKKDPTIKVNEDGDIVEYSPAEIRYRCEQIGVKFVPEFETFVIPCDVNAGEYVMRKVEEYYDGADPIGENSCARGCSCSYFES